MVIFFLGFVLIYTLHLWSTSCYTLQNVKLHGYIYRNISLYGFKFCAKDCLTESWCKSFNYDRINFVFELNYATSDSGYSAANDNYVYSDIATWSRDIVGACSNTTCNVHEKCIVLESGLPYCSQIAFCADPFYTLDNKTNMCYKVVTGMTLDWYDADSYCKSENGYLISMDTKDKVESVQEHLDSGRSDSKHSLPFNIREGTSSKMWIGLTDAEEEGKFKWTNGNEISYTYWNFDQPDDRDGECPDRKLGADFAYVRKSNLWQDHCWKSKMSFICETDVKYKCPVCL